MRLNQLEFLDAANRCGSFSKAAEELHVTQPAISTAVSEFEKELNIKMFIRSKNGLLLTDDGRIIMPLVEQILKNVDRIRIYGEQSQVYKSRYRISSCRFIYHTFLWKVASELKKVYTDTNVEIDISEGHELLSKISENEVQCGIVQMYDVSESEKLGYQRRGIEFEHLWNDAYVFYCREGHPLTKLDSVSIDDVFQYDMITFGYPPERNIYREMQARHYNKNLVNINDIMAVRKYVMNSDTVAYSQFAGFSTIKSDLGEGTVPLLLNDFLFDFEACIVYNTRKLTPFDKEVIGLFKEYAAGIEKYPGLN